MSRSALVLLGSVVAALGVLFTLQGVGLIGGSFMSGNPTWVVLGPVIALVGAALAHVGSRRRGRRGPGG